MTAIKEDRWQPLAERHSQVAGAKRMLKLAAGSARKGERGTRTHTTRLGANEELVRRGPIILPVPR